MKFTLPKRRSKKAPEEPSAPLTDEALSPPPTVEEKPSKKTKAPKPPKAPKASKKEKPPKQPKGPKQKKSKQASAGKSLNAYKISKGSFYVLSIGDEGIILTYLKDKKVEGRWFAANATEENFSVFSKAVATDTKAGMLIVLDTMDQVYSQQTLPPVSKMSLNGLLKRRIKREFGDTELKGNYFLERAETKEWHFMIFAIEQREDVTAWLGWAAEQPVRPLGIRVAPIEMTHLVQLLYDNRPNVKDEAEVATEREWRFLVSHNKVSGFRQVIVRNDKMIFTRLSQPLDGGADVQAGMVEQEVSSTIEYLKRIGLKSYQDIHLNIIASDDIIELLDVKKIGVPSNELLSPYTVSQKFSWDDITQPEDRFGDVFLGVFALTNKKSIVKLWTKPLEKLANIYKISPLLRSVGALLMVAALGYSGLSAYEWWENSDGVDQARLQSNQLTADLEKTKTSVNMPLEELDQALEMFDLYKAIKQKELAPNNFLIDLASAFANMPKDMRVQVVEWAEVPAPQPGSPQAQLAQNPNVPVPKGAPVYITGTMNIQITVPRGIKSEALANRAKGIIEKLQSFFKYYQITLEGIPGVNTNDTLDIDLSNRLKTEELEGFDTLVLTTKIQGIEYIPEPTFEK